MTEEKLKYWLLLYHTPLIGLIRFQEILSFYGDPESAYQQLIKSGNNSGLPQKSITFLQNPDWSAIEEELAWGQLANQHIITPDSDSYPQLLREIPDPPIVLYAIGNIDLLKSRQIAIVGSRNPSKGGKDNAFNFARFLAEHEFTITSGLALGIDSEAHKGALDAKGNTIAVTGTGLDRVYPASNRNLAHNIVAFNGLLLSEYPLKTPALKENFPRRNRIISGLSLGTLVVEAALQSGSLITARTAGEQGREIFAIPGSIHNPLSRGCHQLIRQGAKLVETAEHILEELGHIVEWHRTETKSSSESKLDVPPEAIDILDKMGFDSTSVDSLVEQCGLTPESVSSILLVLELQGFIESLPGGSYIRIK